MFTIIILKIARLFKLRVKSTDGAEWKLSNVYLVDHLRGWQREDGVEFFDTGWRCNLIDGRNFRLGVDLWMVARVRLGRTWIPLP